MIGKKEAARIAQKYVNRDSNPATNELVEVKKSEIEKDEWVVIFALLSEEGDEIDGPIIIRVNEKTGIARSLSEFIEERRKKETSR